MSNLLTVNNINQNIKNLEYAVRGPLVTRANELIKELASGCQKPFESVIRANIGDCHAMNQVPLTYFRQVLACATYPKLLDKNSSCNAADEDIPEDVKQRVRLILQNCGGKSVGAYTDACGIELVRKHCADYICQRDNVNNVDWQNIFLASGASEVVKSFLSFINRPAKYETSNDGDNLPVGIMISIPQYPLYSATICELGMYQVDYYLDEDNDWSLNVEELERAYNENKSKCQIRCIVVINPANPTGAVLSRQNICEIIEFATRHKLIIIADEVYQHNVWAENSKFYSFRNTMIQMNAHTELVSMMSASKGYMGECGLRGGYGELFNFTEDVRAVFYKFLSSRLCSSVLGQITLDCVVNPPKVGEHSYELYEKEKSKILSDLNAKAKLVAETLNSIDGIICNKVAGAMYAFPRILLPEKAIKAAEEVNQKPDFFYLMTLLEETGICFVPGSGFGQRVGTYHFRTTILPQPDTFTDMMSRFTKFHKSFIKRYS